MATIAEQLTSLANTKAAIKQSIIDKGVQVADTDPFSAYPAKIGQISGGSAPATKYGVSIDNLLGNVDENGVYVKPTENFVVNLSGVKVIPDSGFKYAFIENSCVTQFIANDVVSVGEYGASHICSNARYLERFCFDGIEEVYSTGAFFSCANGYNVAPSFKKLRVISGKEIFNNAFYSGYLKDVSLDEIFPSLEEIAGDSVLTQCLYFAISLEQHLSKVRKITGDSTSAYRSVFGGLYVSDSKWYLPSATELTGYVWNIGSSYTGELHFAAANQGAIEACDGYDKKWGFTNATIFFDLIGTITVNGVAYSRKHTIDGYTSWEDADANIVYTNATAEPAVDTPVYSDAGTTQVGTVSEVA